MNILVVGGTGGIGLALVRGLLESYPQSQIIATWHKTAPDFNHPRVQWYSLDLFSENDIQKLSQQVSHIDVLINAAGLLHTAEHQPEKTIKALDADFFYQNIATNTLSSLLLAKHFIGALRSKETTFFGSSTFSVDFFMKYLREFHFFLSHQK